MDAGVVVVGVGVVVVGAGPTDGVPGGLVGLVVLAERVHDGVSGMEIKGTYYQNRVVDFLFLKAWCRRLV
jgi:hypothetical protein